MVQAIITDHSQLTPERLTQILRDEAVLANNEVHAIDFQQMVGHEAGRWRLHVRYADEVAPTVPAYLFLKLSKETHEARFYERTQYLNGELPIVRCYDVAHDDTVGAHILLDDLTLTHHAHPPSQLPPLGEHCEMIIDALADLHGYWWDHPNLEKTFGKRPTTPWIKAWAADDARHYEGFARFLDDRLAPAQREIYRLALDTLPQKVADRFGTGRHLTLTFEDVHVGNFLYPKLDNDPLYMIDWEQWGLNLAMNDLAYMMALFWSPERRARLEKSYLRRYYDRLLTHKVTDYSWDDLWYDYRLSAARQLFVPVFQWQRQHIVDVWWNHLERITAAFTDLDCASLLVE